MPKQSVKQHSIVSVFDEPIYSSKRRPLFTGKAQPTTTGQLLLEMALFATENKRFQESKDERAGRRAQAHLERIKELSEQRQSELRTLMLIDS